MIVTVSPKGFDLKGQALATARGLERDLSREMARIAQEASIPEVVPLDLLSANVRASLGVARGVADRLIRIEPHGTWQDAADDASILSRVNERLRASADVDDVGDAYFARVLADLLCMSRIARNVLLARTVGRLQGLIGRLNAGDMAVAMPTARLLLEESLEAHKLAREIAHIMKGYVRELAKSEPFRRMPTFEPEQVDLGPEADQDSDLDPLEDRLRQILHGRRVSHALVGAERHVKRRNVLTILKAIRIEPEQKEKLTELYGQLSEFTHPNALGNTIFVAERFEGARRIYRFSSRGARSSDDGAYEREKSDQLMRLALRTAVVASALVFDNVDEQLHGSIVRMEEAVVAALPQVDDEAHRIVDEALRAEGLEPCDSPDHFRAAGGLRTLWPPVLSS